MMQIKAMIWDIGGVIWLPPAEPMSAKWASRCGVTEAEFDQIVYGSEWGEQALVGEISREQLFANIGQALHLSTAVLSKLEQDYWRGYWDAELLEFIRSLKPKYKLGILSDAYSGAREAVKPWVNEELFEIMVFSSEERMRKPDPKMYKRILNRLNVRAEDAFFIDDRPKNVRGARQVGIQAIQYKGLAELRDYFLQEKFI